MRELFLLVFGLLVFGSPALSLPAVASPRFEDYPSGSYAGKAAPAVPVGKWRLFQTTIKDAAAEGPNFAGDMTIAEWGCGSGCMQWALISARTGKIVDGMMGAQTLCNGLDYKPDSRLLILNPSLDPENACASLQKTEYRLWDGKRLQNVTTD